MIKDKRTKWTEDFIKQLTTKGGEDHRVIMTPAYRIYQEKMKPVYKEYTTVLSSLLNVEIIKRFRKKYIEEINKSIELPTVFTDEEKNILEGYLKNLEKLNDIITRDQKDIDRFISAEEEKKNPKLSLYYFFEWLYTFIVRYRTRSFITISTDIEYFPVSGGGGGGGKKKKSKLIRKYDGIPLRELVKVQEVLSLQEVPTEVVQYKVLPNLTINDILSFAMTCRRYYESINDLPLSWFTFRFILRGYDIRDLIKYARIINQPRPMVVKLEILYLDIYSDRMPPYSELFPNLKELSFIYCVFTDEDMARAMKGIKGLSKLQILSCHNLTLERAVIDSAKEDNCELTLREDDNITDDGLANITGYYKGIYLTELPLITGIGLKNITAYSHITLSMCQNLTDSNMKYIFKRGIESICINSCRRISLVGVDCSELVDKTLTSISLSGLLELKNIFEGNNLAQKISDKGDFDFLVIACPNLNEISITELPDKMTALTLLIRYNKDNIPAGSFDHFKKIRTIFTHDSFNRDLFLGIEYENLVQR